MDNICNIHKNLKKKKRGLEIPYKDILGARRAIV